MKDAPPKLNTSTPRTPELTPRLEELRLKPTNLDESTDSLREMRYKLEKIKIPQDDPMAMRRRIIDEAVPRHIRTLLKDPTSLKPSWDDLAVRAGNFQTTPR